jgi:Calreticulin family
MQLPETVTSFMCLVATHMSLCFIRIEDPEAKKPDDWDEDAPREIPDEDAQKPEGWLDDEPDEIDDPGAHADL